jgi:predicted GTPase
VRRIADVVAQVTFLLLGLTGHGKSSLINLLFGRLVTAQGHSQVCD